MQWALATLSLVIGFAAYEANNYSTLVSITYVLVFLSFLSLITATWEVFNTGCIGKFCLVAGVFVFYWIDAFALILQAYPYAVPDGFPLNSTQFNQDLIQQALFYVTVFQLLLLVGYSIRLPLDGPLQVMASRFDSLSFARTLIAFLLVICSFAPLLIYYNLDAAKIISTMLASRSGTDFETPEPGLAQHLALFGIFGAALFFVYALRAPSWHRLWWLALAIISSVPFVLSGTRHIWLFISLPSLLIVLRGFEGKFTRQRMLTLTSIAVTVVVVAQVQFVYRMVGWRDMGQVRASEFSQVNTNGQMTALLFAEYLVPAHHEYFREFVEPYFVIHWIPRQVWPNKPLMESWKFYNDSYVQGAYFNVTPSVIGQFHMNWGLPGIIVIAVWLGFLALVGDLLLLMLDSRRQRAMFVVAGMFYAFIISSFRFYSPIYFSYFFFGVLAMFLLTRRRAQRLSPVFRPRLLPT